MSRLHKRDDIFYTGPLMKKGLENYMDDIGTQYMTVKDRRFSNPDSYGPWFMCHWCGSGGPFYVSFHCGVNAEESAQIDEDIGYHKKNWKTDVIQTLGNLVRTKYHITVKDGELILKPLGKSSFDVMILQENLFDVDSHYVEHLTCANCGNFCDIAMETMDGGGGIHPDEIDTYGNQMLITDEPTEGSYKYDKDGKIIPSKTIVAITREGLMDECIQCMNHDDDFKDKYAAALLARKSGDLGSYDGNDIDAFGAMCDMSCPHSHDFWMFRITPIEINNRREEININPNQLKIEDKDAGDIS